MSHNSSFLRSPQSPVISSQLLNPHKGPQARKLSIVEMLSSPPPLPTEPINPLDDFSLSRNTSISSRSSSLAYQSAPRLDWSEIPLVDLTELNKLISINSSYSVQQAFETLLTNNLTSLPVSLSKNSFDLANCLSFDYSDLNTYLLLVMNKISLNDLSPSGITDDVTGRQLSLQEKQERLLAFIAKAKKGEEVPVDLIVKLHPKNPFIKFKESQTLFKAVEAFGNGVHRVAILNAENKITGILSQRRTLRFLWDNARRFPSLEFLLNSSLQDLKVGSTSPLTIHGDQPLIEALETMFHLRVSSLAVIDRNKCLIGNISIVDVKNVSSTKNSHFLFKPVMNFISYNLSKKGIECGQDQFPIFHVSKQSSLGRVIAKLVATQSHRLWIVESRSSSAHPSSQSGSTSSAASTHSSGPASTIENVLSDTTTIQQESGRPGTLIGVVSLTDILGLFAQHKSGVRIDPLTARNSRRRSSTSTTRSSIDSVLLNAAGANTSSAPTTPQSAHIQPNQDLFRNSYRSN
ncbi:hypothetical protein METBIDRAFT_40576 [Metschnikowia bicuspidata var. bicuspidata NRRL YB-4993]|uniref:CBS domain-containing protein n=1 Tax=Metschnikowia bicuspidata var. bicuspidata NRRL YB-4993 TaxID=869754 RepID=A0A1A0HF92_9ASCO|nr:hypothetical protein METBIDRAFT_40576 [Metschnikowia bicuspidata var. bicuspidata NRRL YB-4993]OBA22553.1 hypothetical protein METBIDRAFT_40576 [Metschnikowia bicuspidata var. bicuspidata NRRL YB-4993]